VECLERWKEIKEHHQSEWPIQGFETVTSRKRKRRPTC